MKIVIIDDHDIFRQSLSYLIKECSEHSVVAHSAHLNDLADFIAHHNPDCILLDYHMPRSSPVACFKALQLKHPQLRFAFLTGSRSPFVLQQISECGAHGVAHKQDDSETLLLMLDTLEQGQNFVSHSVAEITEQKTTVLTKRELDVLEQLIRGKAPGAIADSLNISPRTVEKHKENMMKKIDAGSVSQLIDYGHQLKLAEFEA